MNVSRRIYVAPLAFVFLLGVSAVGQTWTQLPSSGTSFVSARDYPSAVYDSATNRLILFGGLADGGPCCTSYNDAWVMTNANGLGGAPSWTQLNPSGPAGLPPVRSVHSAVYDTGTNRMIVFGGGQFGGNVFNVRFNDVWVLTNANGLGGTPQWIPLAPVGGPPAAREGQRAIYDALNNRMTVFGGGNNGIMDIPNDVWLLSNANGLGGTPEWTQLFPSGNAAGPIERFAAGYDPGTNRMVIFGGCCYWNNETFVLTFANGLGGQPQWMLMSPSGTLPSIRETPAFGYDPAGNFLLIFGMGNNTGLLNDTWELSNANGASVVPQWTNLIPDGEPQSPPITSGLASIASAYDAANQRLISLKNGLDAAGNAAVQAWVFALKSPVSAGPNISAGGVVNAASSAGGTPVAPGSIVSIYGNFTLAAPLSAPGAPLPFTLETLSMQFGGSVNTPLFFVSGNQVNAQVPWELSGQSQSSLTATVNGQTSAGQTVNLAQYSPGIFSANGQGTGQGAIVDANGRLVDSSNPAPAGSYISIYCTGLGPVTNQPPSGAATPSNPLAATTATPVAMVAGVEAQVLFSGLAPGFVGEYQINVQVPAGIASGNDIPVAISIGGVTSNTVTIAVAAEIGGSNPQPVITGLSPQSAKAGSSPTLLTIDGSGFLASSTVTFNGIPHAAALVNGGQITITLSAADLSSVGAFPVMVSNPQPGGGASNAINFAVQPAEVTPVLASLTLSASSVISGGSVTATVTLTSAAPLGGAQVSIQDTPAILQTVSLVTIPAGQTTGTFVISAPTVTSPTTVTITANLASVSLSASLSISPSAANPFQDTTFDIYATLSIAGQSVPVEIQMLALSDGILTTLQSTGGSVVMITMLYDQQASQVSVSGDTVTYSGVDIGSVYLNNNSTLVLDTSFTSSILSVTVPSALAGANISGMLTFTSSGATLTGTITGVINSVTGP
jgi:uncharacterized protein (TIGR03437 family)